MQKRSKLALIMIIILSCLSSMSCADRSDSLNTDTFEYKKGMSMRVYGGAETDFLLPELVVKQLIEDLNNNETEVSAFPNDDGADPLFTMTGNGYTFYIFSMSNTDRIYQKLDDDGFRLLINRHFVDFSKIIISAVQADEGIESHEAQELIDHYLDRNQ